MAGNGIPGKLDFTCKQGDTFNSGPMQWTRGGIPVDLTGAVGKCSLRSSTAAGVIASLSVVIDNAVNSQYHIEASALAMATIPANGPTVNDYTQYQQDVRFTWQSSGYSETITQGIFYLIPEVSQQ
jgi:hypothetical protein